MECRSCGSIIADNAKFCPECGVSLNEESAKEHDDSKMNKPDDSTDAPESSPVKAQAADENGTSSQSADASNQTQEDADSTTPESDVSTGNTPSSDGAINSFSKHKKPIIIGALIVVICVIFILIGSCTGNATPFECTETVVVDTISVSYPGEWTLEEGDNEDGETVYIHPPVSGLVMVMSNYSHLDLSVSSFSDFLKAGNMTSLSNIETANVGNHDAYKTKISWNNDGEEYEGYILLVGMDNSYVSCMALAGKGQDPRYLATMEEIVNDVRPDDSNVTYDVVFESEGKVVSSESIANEGGGAIIDPPSDLERAGFMLDGWKLKNESADIDLKKISGSYVIYKADEDVVLEAVWSPAFTVTFTDGEGTILKTQTVKQGGSAIAPSSPTRTGYTFKGWSSTFNDVNDNLTINAEWTRIPTTSESNALKRAKSYLGSSAFSYEGLIDQLEFEKFSHEDAVYAADNCGADWNEQAAKKAKSYMSWGSFSRGSLIDQLVFEGFTPEQAEYGTDSVGL